MAFRRKWASEAQGEWKVHWINGATFKFELEGQGLTDSVVEEWGPWMDTQFELRFPDGNWPSLTAAKLSFSHNDIGDHGIQTIVDYLNRRKISVQLIKFFKNSIGDAGAWAIGELLANSPEPVQEVHLSHNRIGNEGACAIFEAIARSKRYPYKTSDRNSRGIMPVWLRMEYNFIHWGNIAPRLEQHKVSWIAADSRENWVPKDTAAPMVCMHHSYKNQTPAESSSSGQGRESAASRKAQPAWASSESWADENSCSLASISAASFAHHSAGREAQDREEVNPQRVHEYGEAVSDEVPMYVFLDPSAIRRFMSREEGLFTFQGLLNLCQQGNMCCCPTDNSGDVEERDRIIFVVTDDVLDDLAELAVSNPGEHRQVEWLRASPQSYLQSGRSWGILEVLETKLHVQLMKLSQSHEQSAAKLGISKRIVKVLDFAILWESQIEPEGRVLFVTGDEAVFRFGAAACSSTAGSSRRGLKVVAAEELDARFAADRRFGGAQLCEAALRPKASSRCRVILSPQIVSAILGEPSDRGEVPAQQLRHELKEAITLLDSAKQLLLKGHSRNNWEVAKFLESTAHTQQRWQQML